ncbi:7921_t:CDS:10 [Paraglomus brasilianum]|uniref:7921_t:CDS:1 n=1 Tax=Paraglomus brasilianum TaxID=144538 RepID=A0A9N8VT81_9GLOM|nr:7921_t:CDS:10 [Paraglomus brasilianum]
MDFLTRGYKGLLGEKGQPQTAEDTVIKLCDRAANSTLLEDRRAAILGLKGLSREYKLEVGDKGLGVLLNILNEDRADIDTAKAILEILNILCTPDRAQEVGRDLGLRFTDEVLQDESHIHLFLDLLQEVDFYVRFHDIQLLATLLTTRPDRVQDCILTAPMGISKLMDLFDDQQEVIRNEGLLLLISLTETNADIQKIVAFENAFDRLLEIITAEGGLNGGIIVQDCLQLTLNLLRYNVSNQNYFRETSCIQRISGLLGYPSTSEDNIINYHFSDWHDQGTNNILVLLELVRILVAQNNTNTTTNQRVMNQCGMLKPVIELALASNAPSPVKTQAFYALGDLVRANQTNQEVLARARVAVPLPTYRSNESSTSHSRTTSQSSAHLSFQELAQAMPPRSAIMGLIAVAVGAEPESYGTRAAATYAFEAYIMRNVEAQVLLASSIAPQSDDANNSDPITAGAQSAGTLLLAALLEWEDSAADPYVVWFASVIFSHILLDNERSKGIVRGIYTADADSTDEGAPLLQLIVKNLNMANKNNADVRVLIGYLCLLCVWLWDSPKSVGDFLAEESHFQMLITLVTQSSGVDPRVQGLCAFLLGVCYEFNNEMEGFNVSRSTLYPILINRIGIDLFVNRITRLREAPHFKHASQYLFITPNELKVLPDLYFDYQFVEFFKENYEIIQRSIRVDPKATRSPRHSTDTNGNDNDSFSLSAITTLKGVIQTQEAQINELKEKIRQLELESKNSVNNSSASTAQQTLESNDEKYAILESKYIALENKHAQLNKEQEDLLICLAEQEEN